METLIILLAIAVAVYYWFKKPASTPTKTKSAPTKQQKIDGELMDYVIGALDQVEIPRKVPVFDEMASEFFRIAKEDILGSDNPFMQNRLWIADNLILLSKAQVITLNPNCETYLFNHPAISGTLTPYVVKIVDQYASFADIKEKGIPQEEWLWSIEDLLITSMVKANISHRLRMFFPQEIIQRERDWFRPALMASCIWEEDQMRRLIGMKPLLESPLAGLMYSTFINRVVEGHADPLQVWEQRVAEKESSFRKEIYLPSCEHETAFGMAPSR